MPPSSHKAERVGSTVRTESAILNVLWQYGEEAAFLWVLRDQATSEPHYLLPDLAELDRRIEAHLDGLRIAGDAGSRVCQEGLAMSEPGEVFAASVRAFEAGVEEPIGEVLQVVRNRPELARAVVSAFGWMDYEKARERIAQFLRGETAIQRRIGIAAMAIHRQEPGPALARVLRDPEPTVRSRSLRTVGELGRVDLGWDVRGAVGDHSPDCRFWAAWSAALLGDRLAGNTLRQFAEKDSPLADRAADLAGRRMPLVESLAWQRQLAGKRERLRVATKVAGAIGDPALVPWLIEQMNRPELMRVAGEALSMITGVDIAYEDLEGEKPEGFEPGPTENPEDENVAMDPDENLPFPDRKRVEQWWSRKRESFSAGVRHLLGKPMTNESLIDALRNGYQRQRAAAALELAIRNPGQPLFEVRAPGFRQIQALR